MFFNHDAFVDPENNKLNLWRYFELDKLFKLLETECLFFCRADYFHKDDSFEGSFPRREYELQIGGRAGKTSANMLYNIMSKDTFISCWHLSEDEDMAMWKLYSKDKKGVAIKTDIQNFKDSFVNRDRKIFAGKIDYIDYENELFYEESEYNYTAMNGLTLYMHKRKMFSYEKEYRAICRDSNGSNHEGINIKVDLSKLIQEIYLSPFSSETEFDELNLRLKELNHNIILQKSSFNAKPYY